MSNRRDFLALGGYTMAAAGSLLMGAPVLSREAAAQPSLGGAHNLGKFKNLLNARFFPRGNDRVYAAISLSQVTVAKSTSNSEQFSVLFKGDRGQPIPAGTYDLQHDSGQIMQLYLVPAGGDIRFNFYRADFNLIR